MHSTFSTRPPSRTSCFGLWKRLREFRQYHPKGGHLKMTHPLIADLPVYIWLRSHVYRSYPHIALQTMQTRTKGLAPSPTRSLSKYGSISARVSNMQLNRPIQLLSTLRFCEIPCSGLAFRL